MAITDAYATVAQYRAGIDQDDDGEDAELLEYLTAVSRIIERRMGYMPSGTPRHFTRGASLTVKVFNGKGGRRLTVDDFVGILSLSVSVDTTGDQVFDRELEKGTDYNHGPIAALVGPEGVASTWLELLVGSRIREWPDSPRSVEITASWGWPLVPDPVKKGCIAITKAVRDGTKQPLAPSIETLQNRIAVSPLAATQLDGLVREFARGEIYF